MSPPTTDMIDRLYLELSQFAQSTPAKELALEKRVTNLEAALAYATGKVEELEATIQADHDTFRGINRIAERRDGETTTAAVERLARESHR